MLKPDTNPSSKIILCRVSQHCSTMGKVATCNASIPYWQLVCVLGALPLIQILVNDLGKVTEDNPRVWVPATHVKDPDGVLGF